MMFSYKLHLIKYPQPHPPLKPPPWKKNKTHPLKKSKQKLPINKHKTFVIKPCNSCQIANALAPLYNIPLSLTCYRQDTAGLTLDLKLSWCFCRSIVNLDFLPVIPLRVMEPVCQSETKQSYYYRYTAHLYSVLNWINRYSVGT